MSRILIIVIAVIIVAGAFPSQSYQAISQVSAWLDTVAVVVSPGQQTALLLVAVGIGLFALSR